MKSMRTFPVLLFLALFFALSNNIWAQKQTRVIKKDFQINKGDILQIDNKFGDIDILKWDQSQISVSVSLSTEAQTDDEALDILDKMSIEINKEDNIINAETVLNNESDSKSGNKFAVNYTVYVPEWMNLNLSNKFGNIHIDQISGIVNIDLKHGNLRALSLDRGELNPFNQIELSYSNAVIENAGSANLILSFSKFEAEEAYTIEADSKYSGIKILKCNSFKSESKYDNFRFEKIRNLDGNLQYSNLHIVDFSGKLELESTFTGVKIDKVLPSFESMKIDNTRGTYKIGIDSETSFDLYGNSKDGDINVSEFTILEKKIDGSEKYVHATSGTAGTEKEITITVTDGSVSLFKY
jgi:hypothetical protein